MTAQLISPGRLTAAHADLEGIRRCGQCHTFGRRGITNDRCLSCHVPLRRRLADRQGLHAGFDEPSCAACHKEHAGRDLDIVRFDTTAFDHRTTGFDLKGAHLRASCSSCHQSDRVVAADVREFKQQHGALDKTFLGLPTTCVACHRSADPHGDTFSSTCQSCHVEDRWAPAPGFDHGETSFALTGLHRQVTCRSCHGNPESGYTIAHFARCSDCHRDPHGGQMGSSCVECHVASGWPRLNGTQMAQRFDHNNTNFPLVGAHRRLECNSCHDASRRVPQLALQFGSDDRGRQYPTPAFSTCRSCHVDYHHGAFVDIVRPEGSSCDACHSSVAWSPTGFDLDRHNAETTFLLSGEHAPLPCASCHLDRSANPPSYRFAIVDQTCVACHARENPHGHQFDDRRCEDCHVVTGFDNVTFDHTITSFPLDGSHLNVPCASCHVASQGDDALVRTYRGTPTRCRACHTS